jgi:hypothetical protein
MQQRKRMAENFTKMNCASVRTDVKKCACCLSVRGLRGLPLTSSKFRECGTVSYYEMRILQKSIREHRKYWLPVTNSSC